MTLTARDKKQLMVVVALVIVFIVATKDSFDRMKKSKERAKRTQLMQNFAQTGTVSSAVTGKNVAMEGVPSGQTTAIDPFSGRQISIGIDEGGPASFRLSGIVYNAKDPSGCYAIINNDVVKLGETVRDSQFKLTEMSEKEATLCDGKNTLKLKTW